MKDEEERLEDVIDIVAHHRRRAEEAEDAIDRLSLWYDMMKTYAVISTMLWVGLLALVLWRV